VHSTATPFPYPQPCSTKVGLTPITSVFLSMKMCFTDI
jgi:hypothetical protein